MAKIKIKKKERPKKGDIFLKGVDAATLLKFKSKAEELGYRYNEFFEELVASI